MKNQEKHWGWLGQAITEESKMDLLEYIGWPEYHENAKKHYPQWMIDEELERREKDERDKAR